MMKYSFNADEEYNAIKESENLNHSKDNLNAYRELLHIIDEEWVEPYDDLAIGKSTTWYTLKKTCVELVRSILKPRQHTFAQELKLENHPE
nr:hypothetical protein [Tanacetum cinerariifolium]